jgi:hypothetical protein
MYALTEEETSLLRKPRDLEGGDYGGLTFLCPTIVKNTGELCEEFPNRLIELGFSFTNTPYLAKDELQIKDILSLLRKGDKEGNTMIIEAGKRYIRRDGKITRPLEQGGPGCLYANAVGDNGMPWAYDLNGKAPGVAHVDLMREATYRDIVNTLPGLMLASPWMYEAREEQIVSMQEYRSLGLVPAGLQEPEARPPQDDVYMETVQVVDLRTGKTLKVSNEEFIGNNLYYKATSIPMI